MNRTLETAPWPDYAGNPIREGDTIKHPNDDATAVVFVLADETDPNERWRVLYGERGDGWPSTRMSRLCLQVGHKGRAVVVRSVPDQFAGGAEVSPATQLRLARAYRDLLNHAHDEWRARAQRVYCDLRDAIAGLTGAEPQLVQETFEELALRQRFTALPSVSAEQLMRAVDMLRGTAKAGEVQCFTTAATMPPNPADCSIGEGSGSACPGLAVRTLDEIPPLFGVLPHPESAIGYQRLTQLAQVHRSRCDQAFARVAMHGHAPVPFNPETWTGVKS